MQKIALVLAIAAVGEGLIALHLVRQLHAERDNTQALQARVTELERRAPQRVAGATFIGVPAQPTASPFTVAGQSTPAQPRPVTTAATVLPPHAVAPDQQQMREQMAASIERQRTLLKDPEYREAMQTQQKMLLMRSNPGIAKDLNLTADQVDRLFGALADQSLRAMDNMGVWEEQPDPAKLQELQRKAIEQQRADEAELKSVLGEAKYREWQEYQAMAGVRFEAERLRASLATAGVPLDENLAKPLMKVLQEQQQKAMEQYTVPAGSMVSARVGFITEHGDNASDNSVPLIEQSLQLLTQNQRKQREALAHVLTPEQLKVVEEEHNAELQMQRMQLRLMRAQQAAGGLDPAQNAQGVFFAPTSD
jgi:hypothetical protein